MTVTEEFDPNDFPMSPTSVQSARDYYESYLKCEELFKAIPRKELGDDPHATFRVLFAEIESRRRHNPALFRQRVDANEALCSLWLARAKNSATLFQAFNRIPPFKGLSPEDMHSLVTYSKDPAYLPHIAEHLFARGIILVYERSIAGMKTDGAAFLLESGIPVIAMSLRYSRIDSYWFTLMHELAHISLHYAQLNVPIVDDLDGEPTGRVEKEADRLALNSTISRPEWRSCPVKFDLHDEGALYSFASRVGVHPAIVAGRMRRELNRYDLFAKLVNEVNVRKVVWGDE